jgi:predicted DNA-binding transcriptional regulator YafY
VTEQTRRAARLIEIERRLRKNPAGLTVRQLAEALNVSTRTIQRDLNVLEYELGAPLVENGRRRWSLLPGSTAIGAVRFTLHEARALFLAIRLFLRYADEQDVDGISALRKLADALPPAFAGNVEDSVRELESRRVNETYMRTLHVITEAWADSRIVEITYESASAGGLRTTALEPLLLEPSATGAATYVIGYSHEHHAVRTFKLDRVRNARLTEKTFRPRGVDEIRSQLSRSWGGVVLGDDEVDVALEFSAAVARRVQETHWHVSQRITLLSDGRLLFQVRLPSLIEFVPWVRSWGADVLVLAPDSLREQVARDLREAAARYPGG